MSRRRIEVAALAAVLAASGAVPVLQQLATAATKGAPCVAWTDPEGDATTGQASPALSPVLGDKNLDIVATTFSTTADSVAVAIKSVALNASPSDAGDLFYVGFTAGGKNLRLYAARGGTPLSGDSAGVYNGAYLPGKAVAVYDDKASTLTITAKLSDVAAAAGVSLQGAAVTALTSVARDDFAGQGGLVYDDAPTMASPVLGIACGSSSGTKPTSTPSPKPTASKPTTSGGAPPAVADPTKDFPKAGCTTLTDPKGDSSAKVVTVAPGSPNDPDTDLTSLTLRTTTTDLVAYIGVDKLAAGPSTTDGHRFTLSFTFNGHVFAAAASASARGSSALRDGLANSGAVGHVTQLSFDAPPLTGVNMSSPSDRGFRTSGLKATFDLANSRVVLALPIADIEKYGAAKFTGKLTAVEVLAAIDTNTVSNRADTTAKDDVSPTTDTWTVNDNVCFPKKK